MTAAVRWPVAVVAALAVALGLLVVASPAEAAGRTGGVRWGTSGCVYAGSRLKAVKLEGVRVSSRKALRREWAAQWVRVKVTLQAGNGSHWRTVRSPKARKLRVVDNAKVWSRPVLFKKVRKAARYRLVVTVGWYNPRTARIEGRRRHSWTCATSLRRSSRLTCPTGLRWANGATFIWNAVAGATGYYVRQRRTDGALSDPVTVRGTSAAFPDGRGSDPNYDTWVEPFNGNGTINCPQAVRGRTDRLTPSQPYLRPGARLTSPSGRFYVVMQGDGNLVLYEAGTARWSIGQGASSYAVIQGDGNLVVYPTAGGSARWSARTNGIGTGAQAIVTDAGYFVVLDSAGAVRWRGGGSDCKDAAGCRS